MLRYIRFQQVVVADENYHHFPLIENSSYTDISKTDFFPLFFRTSGTYSEVILKDSERYHVGYTKRSSYTGCMVSWMDVVKSQRPRKFARSLKREILSPNVLKV